MTINVRMKYFVGSIFIPLYERQKLIINSELSIERYPTTGIDNMLVIKSEECVIMNYNDCNIPRYTRDRISKQIGKIDILLTNFNSAGKIIDYPIQNDHAIKTKLKNMQALNSPAAC